MDELFRFSISRPVSTTNAETVSLARNSTFQNGLIKDMAKQIKAKQSDFKGNPSYGNSFLWGVIESLGIRVHKIQFSQYQHTFSE